MHHASKHSQLYVTERWGWVPLPYLLSTKISSLHFLDQICLISKECGFGVRKGFKSWLKYSVITWSELTYNMSNHHLLHRVWWRVCEQHHKAPGPCPNTEVHPRLPPPLFLCNNYQVGIWHHPHLQKNSGYRIADTWYTPFSAFVMGIWFPIPSLH